MVPLQSRTCHGHHSKACFVCTPRIFPSIISDLSQTPSLLKLYEPLQFYIGTFLSQTSVQCLVHFGTNAKDDEMEWGEGRMEPKWVIWAIKKMDTDNKSKMMSHCVGAMYKWDTVHVPFSGNKRNKVEKLKKKDERGILQESSSVNISTKREIHWEREKKKQANWS